MNLDQSEWDAFVESLIDAKRALAEAFSVMNKTEGLLGSSEKAPAAALDSIDADYAGEEKYAEEQGLENNRDQLLDGRTARCASWLRGSRRGCTRFPTE